MRRLSTHALGLAVGLLLSSFVAVASARNISVSNQNIRAVWRGLAFESKLMQMPPLEAISCSVTMEGSFSARTFPKVVAQIGAITRAIASHPCREVGGNEYSIHNGTETVLRGIPETSLPWAINYTTFTGTLPLIRTINVRIVGIIMTVIYPVLGCLQRYGSATESRPWLFSVEANGGVTSLEPAEEHLIRRAEANILCAELARLSGTSGPVTLLGTTNQISMRLI